MHMDGLSRLKAVKQLCSTRSGAIRSAVKLYLNKPGSLPDGRKYEHICCDIQYQQAENKFLVSFSLLENKSFLKPTLGFTINSETGECISVADAHSDRSACEGDSLVGLEINGAVIAHTPSEDGNWQEGQFSPEGIEFSARIDQIDNLLKEAICGKQVSEESIRRR